MGRILLKVSGAASVSHVLTAIALELCKGGKPPEIHFGWSDEGALAACAAVIVGQHDFRAVTPTETDHVFFDRTVLAAALALAAVLAPHAEAGSSVPPPTIKVTTEATAGVSLVKSQAKVRSTTHLILPRPEPWSVFLRAIRGVIPLSRSA